MGTALRQPDGIARGNRIDLLRVLLTIGIVSRHALMEGLPNATAGFSAFTQGVIALTVVCVPLFYAISGYLFFRNTPEKPEPRWFWDKIRSRFFSLLIPYLIANCIAWGCYYFALKAVPSMVSGFLGDDWKNPLFVFWTGPINLSLWFIRELIVMVVISPLIYLFVRYLRWWGVLALGILWGFKLCPEPVFFFSLGACLSIWKISPVERWLHAPSQLTTRSRAWTYFIYLYHYLLLIGVKKFFFQTLHPESTLTQIGTYLLAPVLVLGLLTAFYWVMRKVIPRITSILVGGK